MTESDGITFAGESEGYHGARVERPAEGTKGVSDVVVNIENGNSGGICLCESETRQARPEALRSHASLRSWKLFGTGPSGVGPSWPLRIEEEIRWMQPQYCSPSL
jgi:hypothetical protein